MFCPSCGKEISDEAIFCPSCGKSVGNVTNKVQTKEAATSGRFAASDLGSAPVRNETQASSLNAPAEVTTGASSSLAGKVGGIVGAIIAIGILLFLLRACTGQLAIQPSEPQNFAEWTAVNDPEFAQNFANESYDLFTFGGVLPGLLIDKTSVSLNGNQVLLQYVVSLNASETTSPSGMSSLSQILMQFVDGMVPSSGIPSLIAGWERNSSFEPITLVINFISRDGSDLGTIDVTSQG